MPSPKTKIMYRCDACGDEFQFGPDVYDGQHLLTYHITVCVGCYGANRDGWAPRLEGAVTRRLRKNGLPIPDRNAKGLLPRG